MRLKVLISFALGLLLSSPSWAATVNVDHGRVSIDRGNGYSRVAGPTQATAGDRVMASPGGWGRIVYAEGCVVEVKPGTVVVVQVDSPCKVVGVMAMAPFTIGAAIAGTGFAISVIDNNDNNAPASP